MKDRVDKKEILKCFLIFILFLVISIIFRNVKGDDYNLFLSHWIDDIVDLGKIDSLSTQIGNYTPPYIYFLILGTYITTNKIFWIKFVSNVFTIGIVVLSYFIIKKFKNDIKLSSVLLILLIPGVIINSSVIGQCDSIYTFFVLLFVLLILNDKKRLALFFFGVSLGFKLQAIFVAPIFLYLLLKRKIRIIDLIYIPIGFLTIMIPALIYGRNIIDIIWIMFKQTKTYKAFSNGAPNIYSTFHLNHVKIDNILMIILSFLVVLFTVFIVVKNTKGKEYSDKIFLEKVTLLSLLVPYFLPSIHDRYFYMANIFLYILILFVDNRNIKKSKKIIDVVLMSFAMALPVYIYNFIYVGDNDMYRFLGEWLGISIFSSTIMFYIVILCLDRYLFVNNVTKRLQ